ncbi:hypothetical protein AGMMS49525_09030 [Bacteroidia bacterium]|nr:hypothetical protein AGMMS49525_09030 [Bacteroidia bacterium]
MKKIGAFLLIVGWCATGLAQTTNSDPDLNREMTLEKDYVPTVKDANKINRLPDITAPTAPQTPVQFANYMSVLDMPTSLYPLKSSASAFGSGEQMGYVNLGASTLPNFLADAGFQILRLPTDRLNIYASHRSGKYDVTYIDTDIKNKKKINDNVFGLNYLHKFSDWKIFADAQYTYSQYNNYAWHESLGFDTDFTNNLFLVHAGAASTTSDNLSFLLNATYTRFNQKYNTSETGNENRLLLDFDLNAPLDFDKRIGLSGSVKNYSFSNLAHTILLDASGNTYYDDEKHNYTILSAAPYLLFEGENWETHLGLSVSKQFGDQDKLLLAPDVRFHVQASDEVLFYVLAQGGFTDNSNYELFYQNRYLDPVRDSRTRLNAKLGVDLAILSNLNVDLHTSYRIIDDEWFEAPNVWLPAYADAKVLNVGGAVRYALPDLVDVELNVDYYKWKISDDENSVLGPIETVFNKPKFIANLKIGFTPIEPLRFDLAYRLEMDRKIAVSESPVEALKLDDIHDVSLRGTYSFTKHFSAFVSANNLLFQKYDLWRGYPANPFHAMGGISYQF